MNKLSELASSRDLIVNLTLRELRSKYKRSALGWAWSLLNPLTTVAIFTVVFRVFLRIPPPTGDPSGLSVFALFLLCGLVPWTFFSTAVGAAIGSLVSNANLIQKVWFPREIIVGATVLAGDVSFLIELGVLSVVLLLAGNMVLPWLPVALVLVVVLTLFVLGLGLLLSVLNVYFRDVQYLFGLVMQVWFYATPIVYPRSFVPATAELAGFTIPLRRLYDLNPMVGFVEAFRDALYHLRMPTAGAFAYLVGVALTTLVAGVVVFGRMQARLAEEL